MLGILRLGPQVAEDDSDGERGPLAHERKLLRKVASDPMTPAPLTTTKTSLSQYTLADSVMLKAIRAYHQKIPKGVLITWLSNLRSCLEGMAGSSSSIPLGSGCSGTDLWVHCVESLLAFWHDEFGTPAVKADHSFAAEIDAVKRDFLNQQFDLPVLAKDIEELSQMRVWNLKTGSMEILRPERFFAGGFSCKGHSKQNSQRGKSKSCVRDGQGTTGKTFESCRKHISKARPLISFLENVPEITQSSTDDDTGLSSSDEQYIISRFEEDMFTVIPVTFNARSYGSPAERVRWWAIILDIPPSKSAEVKSLFNEVLGSMKLLPFPIEEFLIDDGMLATMCEPLVEGGAKPSKRAKSDLQWKSTHEQAFAEEKLTWPPTCPESLAAFRHRREAEVAFFADVKFPATTVGVWEWFDTNHCFERTFRYPPGENEKLRCPWKPYVPTLTASSAMVGRKKLADGTTTMKRLHALECMRIIGWDHCFWKGNVSPFSHKDDVAAGVLNDMSGSAWSAFAFVPVAIAALGCAHWSLFGKGFVESAAVEPADAGGSDDEGASSSDASTLERGS